MTRIIAAVSQKGGVGKTSFVQNVGAELAQAGHQVLLIDFDPQANLTIGWGLDPADDRPTIYKAMLEPAQSQRCIVQIRAHLDLIPADLDLAGAERQFAGDFDRNDKLRDTLTSIQGRYQFILIDCPPSLGFYTANALIAATEAVIPLQCQFYAFKMLDPVLALIEQARKGNTQLKVSAIVPTMFDLRNSLSEPVVNAARERFGDLITRTIIPVNVRIADAPIHGLSVSEHDPKSTGANAYRKLAEELVNRG